jgi:hypothetical protein
MPAANNTGDNMNKIDSKEACRMAIGLIEAQLRVLPLSLSALSPAMADAAANGMPASIQLHRKQRPAKSGSAAVIAAADAGIDTRLDTGNHLEFDLAAPRQALQDNPKLIAHAQRTLVGNALLAVGMFFREHGIAATRTPEVQFLGHVCNAILNVDTFRIEAGYVPGASFDGLTIDSSLDGAPLFGDGDEEGFMEFGDAVALLQRLAQSLRGTREFVSGGDAG